MSFLIRFSHEESLERPLPEEGWTIEVDHIQSGQSWMFYSLDQMLNFLAEKTSYPENFGGAPE